MSALRSWSIIIILYQTLISLVISWWTLSCRFTPNSTELYEVTLMKLLYLYDPEACGRLHFYNITVTHNTESYSTIMWPVKNKLASTFRSKIRLWLCLHVSWFCLAVINATHGQRPCGFYAVLVPFTITGLAMLATDLVYMGIFLQNIQITGSQTAILDYMSPNTSHNMKWINKPLPWPPEYSCDEDTSWISLSFAYISSRCIVQWFINFWLVKDNYYEGLAEYHRLQKEKSSRRSKA